MSALSKALVEQGKGPESTLRSGGFQGHPRWSVLHRCAKFNAMVGFLLWLLLLVLAWPLALAALILYPLVWVIALPFRLVGVSVKAVFELLTAIITFPVRLLRR